MEFIFLISVLVVGFLLVILALVASLYFEQSEKNSVLGGMETVLFLVMMPQNKTDKDGQAQNEEKVLISQMEQVLTNFLYLKKPRLFKPAPSVTLEIASQIGGTDISFYVAVPKYLETNTCWRLITMRICWRAPKKLSKPN